MCSPLPRLFAGVWFLLALAGFMARGAEQRIMLGNEVLAAGGFKELAGKRVGLITNPSGVNNRLTSTIDVLRAAAGVKLVALFGPEHGIYGDVPAGDKIESRTDPRTGLPVHSLYGATRKPTPAMLKGLNAVVYDLQDTGSRSYTFVSTMGLAMEACAEAGVEFIVLDRPNPLGGLRVEGPMLVEKFRSFVSQWDVPYVYGLTCGELARMINDRGWIKKRCKLTVVPMRGWKRSMVWSDTNLPWVPASPHVPHGESPLFQVATGMLGEIGGVSIGIGYTLPFQTVAAPNVSPQALAARLNAYGLPGVHFRPLTYKPYYAAFKDEVIGGVQLHFTDPARAPLTAINYYALEAFKAVSGRDVFAEAPKANKKFDMFDKVNGTDATRLALQSGKSAAAIVAAWRAGEDKFRKEREKYLLY
ncbi:exo-beta-N-acetylmuramidase NamZ family protein [Horticoccus sp. 23ND18S-11]|uniref:exo-beta-N-acetylmuramidase NamZ family protein n=1 Tax=Horticoccus sp. 23ND18S-11 TaxID=3391832 RepID=UPI0039C8FD52